MDAEKARTQMVDDVEDRIFAELFKELKVSKTEALAREFYNTLTDPEQFDVKVQDGGLEVKETEHPFRFDTYIRGVGRDQSFTAAALELNVGEIAGPVKGTNGYYVIQLTEKEVADSVAFQERKDEMMQQIMNQKQNQFYTQWIEHTKEKAEIEDYRYMYYTDY
jgi:peptidyl-prolyl cis-trans isomerase D